ncbi:hypothetical protein TraAM80_05892 [Trypanosoma rangeli]|uniref:Uncharacterized protein n=1 Tax=Trypanosoma rangeli TaxID=5698 RepID=A0A422NCP8_TRYRA|nr:uncharacterized protein TraAM80_05892 [Trypanosoma rangeli]RNF03212.1 hypothetical protein TraAM80_05892 [Trypanosoma rangeli]|eukprot:RNF03212.1 hypothetical protein TraAM80_05892 [Trypanosoma rangeli]
MSLLWGTAASSWAEDEAYLAVSEAHGGDRRYSEPACPREVVAPVNAGPATSAATLSLSLSSLPSQLYPLGSSKQTPVADDGNCGTAVNRPPKRPFATGSNEQFQLECLASIAYLVGSPLQRRQPTLKKPVQQSMKLVRELLRRGVDPEQVIRVIESREGVRGGE